MNGALDRLRAMTEPPQGASPVLRALWHEAKGDWPAAHTLVEEPRNAEECLMHAFLHRVEGDLGNAAYWYRRAGVPVCRDDLETERAALAERWLL